MTPGGCPRGFPRNWSGMESPNPSTILLPRRGRRTRCQSCQSEHLAQSGELTMLRTSTSTQNERSMQQRRPPIPSGRVKARGGSRGAERSGSRRSGVRGRPIARPDQIPPDPAVCEPPEEPMAVRHRQVAPGTSSRDAQRVCRRSTRHGEEHPRFGHALEGVLPSLGELHSGADNEILYR